MLDKKILDIFNARFEQLKRLVDSATNVWEHQEYSTRLSELTNIYSAIAAIKEGEEED